MLNWIKDFLRLWSKQVRVGGSLSDTEAEDNGTPQRSVSSPVLFNIIFNDMCDGVGNGFGRSVFAEHYGREAVISDTSISRCNVRWIRCRRGLIGGALDHLY